MNHTGVRVWVDDRHPIFRSGLIACLRNAGFVIAGESASLDPPPHDHNVLIFEGDDGGIARATKDHGDHGRLIALVRAPHERLLGDAMNAGVAGILVRGHVQPAALISTVRTVAAGNTTIPSDLMPRLLEHTADPEGTNGVGRLTDREISVLTLLASGEDTRGIAGQLCYSDRTVKNIVHDVLMKLNCRNRAHAVALATRQGLI